MKNSSRVWKTFELGLATGRGAKRYQNRISSTAVVHTRIGSKQGRSATFPAYLNAPESSASGQIVPHEPEGTSSPREVFNPIPQYAIQTDADSKNDLVIADRSQNPPPGVVDCRNPMGFSAWSITAALARGYLVQNRRSAVGSSPSSVSTYGNGEERSEANPISFMRPSYTHCFAHHLVY